VCVCMRVIRYVHAYVHVCVCASVRAYLCAKVRAEVRC